MAWQDEIRDEVRQMMNRIDEWKNASDTEGEVGDKTRNALDGVNNALRNVISSVDDEEDRGGFKGLFS